MIRMYFASLDGPPHTNSSAIQGQYQESGVRMNRFTLKSGGGLILMYSAVYAQATTVPLALCDGCADAQMAETANDLTP
jgi:hypothetical protein